MSEEAFKKVFGVAAIIAIVGISIISFVAMANRPVVKIIEVGACSESYCAVRVEGKTHLCYTKTLATSAIVGNSIRSNCH